MDPKKIYKWLDGLVDYDGVVPGSHLAINFTKSEKGLTGSVLGYSFKDYPQINLAVALGAIIDVRGLSKSQKAQPLTETDPLFSSYPNIARHATYHDYSHLLPEALKATNHRLILDQPNGPPGSDPKAFAPAVHLVGSNHKILHNHVYDPTTNSFDGLEQAQKSGIEHAVKAAFHQHVGQVAKEPPPGPPRLTLVKAEVPLRKEYRPRILTTGGPGGFIPKTPNIQPGESEIKLNPNRKQKPSLELKPSVGGARKINIPGLKPVGEKPGPDNALEAAELPKRPTQSLKVGKALAHKACPLCGIAQMSGNAFVGCDCYSAMAKSVSVRTEADSYTLTFGDEWDADAVSSLDETFKS